MSLALVHPGGLEEAAVVVVGGDGLARLGGEDDDLARVLGELVHVVRQPGDAGAHAALASGPVGSLGPCHGVVIGIGRVAGLVALELATP